MSSGRIRSHNKGVNQLVIDTSERLCRIHALPGPAASLSLSLDELFVLQ
ncbi:MAG: hypothetical protein ABFD97_08650 [Syntrophobacter sp.]